TKNVGAPWLNRSFTSGSARQMFRTLWIGSFLAAIDPFLRVGSTLGSPRSLALRPVPPRRWAPASRAARLLRCGLSLDAGECRVEPAGWWSHGISNRAGAARTGSNRAGRQTSTRLRRRDRDRRHDPAVVRVGDAALSVVLPA